VTRDDETTELDVFSAHLDGLFESVKGYLTAIIVLLVVIGFLLVMVIGRLGDSGTTFP
jgi:hypothetical protein